eukprot:TRINITY_DN1996_c0_g1_i1.p1 TRINITY_DN1996_c0_g1~~TRINITY_DN1996_c0_g1_i1.p1  ORF type:complete len:566 (-),score=159.47 TRINITY_DN1996_c0_g1_i1:1404-3101(-)
MSRGHSPQNIGPSFYPSSTTNTPPNGIHDTQQPSKRQYLELQSSHAALFKQFQQLEAKLKILQTENTQLRRSHESASSELTVARKSVDKMLIEKQEKDALLKECETKLKKLEFRLGGGQRNIRMLEEHANMSDTIRDLKQALQSKEQDMQVLAQERDTLSVLFDQKLFEFGTTETGDAKTLLLELGRSKYAVQVEQKKSMAMQQELESLREENDALKTLIEDLSFQKEKFEHEKADFEAKYQNAQQNYQMTLEQLEELKVEYAQALEILDSSTNEGIHLRSKVQILTREIENIKQEKDAQIYELEEKKLEAENIRDEMARKVESNTKVCSILEENARQLREKLSTANQQLETLEEKYKTLLAQSRYYEESESELQSMNQQLLQQVQAKEQKIQNLQIQVESLKEHAGQLELEVKNSRILQETLQDRLASVSLQKQKSETTTNYTTQQSIVQHGRPILMAAQSTLSTHTTPPRKWTTPSQHPQLQQPTSPDLSISPLTTSFSSLMQASNDSLDRSSLRAIVHGSPLSPEAIVKSTARKDRVSEDISKLKAKHKEIVMKRQAAESTS